MIRSLIMTDTEIKDFFPILDALRDSGAMNMFGAPRWLIDNMDITKQDAKTVFLAWLKTC
jgi:hypothetical protein